MFCRKLVISNNLQFTILNVNNYTSKKKENVTRKNKDLVKNNDIV